MIPDYTLTVIENKLNLRTGAAKQVLEELIGRKLIMFPPKTKNRNLLAKELADLWMVVNAQRVSTTNSVNKSLAAFEDEFQKVTDEQVLDACQIYLETISNPQYVKSLANFIYDFKSQDSLLSSFIRHDKSPKNKDFSTDL